MSEITTTSDPTIAPEDLEAAVAAGIVPRETATALTAFVLERRSGPSATADEEDVRFVTSFNDLFVTIGIGLVVGAATAIGMRFAPFVAAPVVAVIAWALAEVFTARRRMAFPSIVLVAIFVAACGGSVGMVVGREHEALGLIGAGAAMMIGAYAHWRRFRVPISPAAMAAGAIVTAFAIFAGLAKHFVDDHFGAICLIFGLAVFAAAMVWDASDRERRTRRTDTAFWLHILAAPLIVHPLAGMLGAGVVTVTDTSPGLVLAMFLVLAIVAIVVDRRALLVSALIYLGGSILVLIRRSGWSGSIDDVATIGLVGVTVLTLSIAWAPLRAVVLRFVPTPVRAVVPAPRPVRGAAS